MPLSCEGGQNSNPFHFTLGLFPVGNMMLHTQKKGIFQSNLRDKISVAKR